MKPFKINRNSWHYKLNKNFFNTYGISRYRMEDHWEPKHNSFCSYWRATMWRCLFASLLLAGLLTFVLIIGSKVYADPISFLVGAGIIIGVIAIASAITFFIQWLHDRVEMKAGQPQADKPESLLMQRYRAYKSKICPVVEFEQ